MTAAVQVRWAYWITAHGFGHASRACAVMEALLRLNPSLHFDLFTQVPAWFFADALPSAAFTLHPTQADVGLVQSSPMEENLPATLEKLAAFLPLQADQSAQHLRALGCRAVLCDISPLGLQAAQSARLPSALIENFTWDWIYTGYLERAPQFSAFLPLLEAAFRTASFHIQTEPVCAPNPQAHLRALPASRLPRASRAETRRRLGIPEHAPAVLITMGGIPDQFEHLHRLSAHPDVFFVIPGAVQQPYERRGNLILLAHHSDFYHPDLMAACDAAVGKAGYSTIAEVYQNRIPFAFVSRSGFREARPLAEYILAHLPAVEIPEADFRRMDWLDTLPALLSLPRPASPVINGADQMAQFLCKNLPNQPV
ncbi:glycosyltransferase family protein [Levilinea saccharolytica]|uniref:Glycosyl transferase family 28 C-terminal domain-containing protein n=1 Tax=Levilinea saccharolytica TaxID=229921 RepID=A0A0N8GQE6_9CHLR|nr:hypothetical protein [Levilinea saccharolytica]KPL83482.1 hypothetical protein ADN01_08225 [Levilinea saccharolytica]GAP18267.1 UDP-N-acetylglucosamine:LPS N-acetylglucosamine transferase [Levilinea saccharolytica]